MVVCVKRKPGRVPLESAIQRAILDALKWRTDVDVWRSNSGAARLVGRGGKLRPVFFGVPGQGDISGIIRPWGVRLEIECKRPGSRQSEHQKIFERRIMEAGGIYILATSHEECTAKLDAAIARLKAQHRDDVVWEVAR